MNCSLKNVQKYKSKNEFRKAEVLPKLAAQLDTALVDKNVSAASDAAHREMAEMVDCTRTTYVLECISVLCASNSQNQVAFASVLNALEKLRDLLHSTDLREVYHAINTIGAVTKNNKKVKRALVDLDPTLVPTLEQLAQYDEKRLAALAEQVLKIMK